MGLAILIWVIGVIIAILAIIAGRGEENIVALIAMILMLFGVIGGLFMVSPLDYPSYTIAPYHTVADGQGLAFDNYTKTDDYLYIPTHYYRKTGFVNSWEYCESPIKIEIPEGYNLVIDDITPSPVPHIVEGGCK